MFRSPFADGVVVLIVLLLFFGPKRLPMLSRSVGESIKEFKGGINEATGSSDTQALNSAPQAPTTESRQPVDTGAERSS
jgi:sec-independent protein translocase protein TatA